MKLVLSEAERLALMSLVKVEISDLGPEIRHTYDAAFKEQLRSKRKMLRQIHERLQTQPQTV